MVPHTSPSPSRSAPQARESPSETTPPSPLRPPSGVKRDSSRLWPSPRYSSSPPPRFLGVFRGPLPSPFGWRLRPTPTPLAPSDATPRPTPTRQRQPPSPPRPALRGPRAGTGSSLRPGPRTRCGGLSGPEEQAEVPGGPGSPSRAPAATGPRLPGVPGRRRRRRERRGRGRGGAGKGGVPGKGRRLETRALPGRFRRPTARLYRALCRGAGQAEGGSRGAGSTEARPLLPSQPGQPLLEPSGRCDKDPFISRCRAR